ncbi:MAG: sodium:solute symporter [Geminicoccaceae bacterium]
MDDVAVSIATLDFVIIGLYFAVVLAIGIWVSKTTETGDDLFLAGRTLTWGVIGFSLFASNISSTTLIGLAGAAYSGGIPVSTYEWMSGVPLIILAVVFVPMFLKARISTIPEFLELRFDRRSRSYFSAITILLSIIVDTAGGLYAGAVVVKVFVPEIEIWQTVIALGLFAGLYTAAGGLKAVVYTDVIQAVVLIFGTILTTWILFARLDYSWTAVKEAAPPDHLSLVRPLDDPMLPGWGIPLGVFFLGFWYWVTNQYIVQRVLGARSVRDAQWGSIMAGFLKIIPLFTMVIPGVMAIRLFPDLPNPDMVFPTLVTEVLPVGITGLVLAGLVAAIMSSVDSTLNSASTLVVHDFVEPRHPEFKPERIGFYGRVTTIILMIIAILWAPMISNFGGLWSYLQQAFSILVPPIAAIFLIGAFWKRGNGDGAFTALRGGHAVGLVVFAFTQLGYWPVHFTINVGVMTAVSAAIFVVVSLRTAPPDAEQVAQTTWRPEMAAEGTEGLPWYKDYRYQSVLLLVAMAWVLIGFW